MSAVQQARLSKQQVDFFWREGYVLPNEPLLPENKFQGLQRHFEDKLARLPADVRPEGMDVPHFTDPKLFEWLFADEVLDMVEPLLGPDIALFSSHFICKPKGNGKKVPWHEDSAYWGKMISPMQVVTVWLAIDPSTRENGCMKVIPRTHENGYSDYGPVDTTTHVFGSEIKPHQVDLTKAVYFELQPGFCSLHESKLMHGSDANSSNIRRCGYTMRYISAKTVLNPESRKHHQLYLARGKGSPENVFADPAQSYEHLARYRETVVKHGH